MKLWVPAAAIAAVLTVGGLPALTLALADDPTPSASPHDETPEAHGRKLGPKNGHEPPGRVKADCRRDQDHGPPPWAGAGTELTPEEKRELKDERKEQRRELREECKDEDTDADGS